MAVSLVDSEAWRTYAFLAINGLAEMREGSSLNLKVLLTGEVDDDRMAELAGIAPGATLIYCKSPAELEAEISDAEVVAGQVSPSALKAATRLKWVHSWAAGPNMQLFPEMLENPVLLTCSKGNGAIPLAEHAMMLMLMLNRDAMQWIEAQRERRWAPRFHGELNGLTCGILGAGNSGQDLALKAKAFHMRVVGLRRTAQKTPHFDRMYSRDELNDFLAEIDFLVVTAPNTPETRGMLGEAEFQMMKRSAFYICFSRGGIADDDALLRALQEGWIAGAGLDAHGIEPLPAESPFWTAPNTIVTPHNGATTQQTKTRGYEIFRDNFVRYVNQQPLTHIVDKQAGY